MTPEPESDLHWTAFLYVSSELAPEESADFERLLDDDQAARDAVASAVELAGAMALIGPARSARSRRPARTWAISIAAAACLAAAALPLLLSPRPAPPDASEVAQAWSGLRDTAGGESDAEWMARGDGSLAPEAAEAQDDDGSAERALPSWLLSATSADRDESRREEN